MFCNNCGAQNPDGANNCSNCGARLNNTQQTSQPAAPVQPVTPAQPQKPKNNKGLIIGIVAGVVALIAVVAVVLVFVLGGDKDKDDEKDGSSTTKAAVTQDAGDKDKDNKDNNSNDKPATSDMSYQDVVKEYLKLVLSGDFKGAIKYSAIDVEGYLTDVAASNGLSMSELYDVLEGIVYDESGEEVEITSIDQFYTAMGKALVEERGNYTVTDVKITGSDLLDVTDSYDMDCIKEELVEGYAHFEFGFDENDLPKYVDTSKITEAYDVEADVTITYSDGTSETIDLYLSVINYNGNWLVVDDLFG